MEEQLNSITTIIGFLTSHQNLGSFFVKKLGNAMWTLKSGISINNRKKFENK